MNFAGITDRGKIRQKNQDDYRAETAFNGEIMTAVLCDGMGGEKAGEVASALACDSFMFHAAASIDKKSTQNDMENIIKDAVAYANKVVYDKAMDDLSCFGMGTTLVSVIINGKKAAIANVGDSRCYLFSGGKLRQITKDHSYVADLLEKKLISPEEAKVHPRRSQLLRAIGTEPSVNCDVFGLKLKSGDRLLLCSDGLINSVPEEVIRNVFKSGKAPDKAVDELLRLALAAGARDNVTIFIAQL
ncbi:MAG: Stp1/IreP family PP2C-type Ser/Thr phosphatase [Oscillospiraceae bacterium]|nr:Stp1/IreP family PP2C-type Ser/Thr phosphatase [Oscillospiraceae bacterium]